MNTMRLSDYTPARVDLGRAGVSIPTGELLRFQLAHARARDAVRLPLAVHPLVAELKARGLEPIALRSAAASRDEYLKRPDLGRRLSSDSGEKLAGLRAEYDVVFVIADGLSALAVHRHATTVLAHLIGNLDFRIAPVVVVEQGRVAIGDEIGGLLGAKLAVVLVGERPGLSSPDSLGVYLTWDPRPGRTDAERNCISNIRPEGLSYEVAAHKLLFLMREARRLKLSGVRLKEEASALMGETIINPKVVGEGR
jgi:ethanolamine ammonia-lyase small subunit